MPLLVLLIIGAVGGAFAGILIPLCLPFEAVKNHPDRLLGRGVSSGDIEELLGGSRALRSQLVNQGFACSPRQESSYDVGVGDVGQLVALPGKALDVPMKSFPGLLLVVF